ncbi:gluconate 2-dehydrogenase subunit 3 family protein [Spirosoma soli]|uniref:Gluconate 2-dehydrogenase subunit 3 family protein n=1 Tax=Spirosoma soli TaxID=1770529 RepID=A0ABW5M4J8_9BACT
MNRRDALMRVAALAGATMSLPALADTLEASAARRTLTGKPVFFTADQDATVAELADTIIPTTSTPGAKAAKVNEVIDVILKDCYKEDDQKRFVEGLAQTNKLSQDAYGKAFVQLDPTQRIEIVKKLEADAKEQRAKMAAERAAAKVENSQADLQMPEAKKRNATPFFTMLKDLTLTGYFTSEIGCTQALEYVAVPGRYDGCVPLKPGQKAWAI